MFGAAVAISRLHYVRICPKCDNFALTKPFEQRLLQGYVNSNAGRLPQVVRNFSSWKSDGFNRSWRTYIIGWNRISQQTLSKSNILKRFTSSKYNPYTLPLRVTETKVNPLKINTNVKNNVMLYRFEKDTMMRAGFIFGIASLIACLFMADNVYLILCKDLFKDSIPLMQRIRDHAFPLAAIAIGVFAGPAIILGVWIITVRTIKYVILHKGGETVTIVTFHPLKSTTSFTVPVKDVNCKTAREDIKAYAMIEIKNKKYQYVLDKGGSFVNPELFDCTVGVSRE